MKKNISITLKDTDWLIVLDGLKRRAQDLEHTAYEYETFGDLEGFAEVNNATEALLLARWYHRIAEQVQQQFDA